MSETAPRSGGLVPSGFEAGASDRDDSAPREQLQQDEDVNRTAGLGDVGRALIFPIYFVVLFTVCYVSAFHDPLPNDAPIAVVGTAQVTAPVVSAIETGSGGRFAVSELVDADAARAQVERRDLVGAIVMTDRSVTTLVSGGEGSAVASAVGGLGSSVAEQRGVESSVEDLAPLADGDGTGTVLFYFVIVCTIGGYLTATVLGQAFPRQRRRRALGALAAMSVLTPALTGALATPFVGILGADVGTLVALLTLGSLYVFTVGAITFACQRLFGRLAMMAVLLLVVFINFPSAGGGIPAPLLPDVWQAVHQFWFGAQFMEAARNLVYFTGAPLWPLVLVLLAWTIAGLGVIAAVRTAPGAGGADGADGAARTGAIGV